MFWTKIDEQLKKNRETGRTCSMHMGKKDMYTKSCWANLKEIKTVSLRNFKS
jgi:hypothetical protein